MKLSITLIFVFLLCSCEKEKEAEETEPIVFNFEYQGTFPNEDTPEEELKYLKGIKWKMFNQTQFTYSQEDNCTYYIFKEKLEMLEGNESSFHFKPTASDSLFMDENGNVIWENRFTSSRSGTPLTSNQTIEDGWKVWKGTIYIPSKSRTGLTLSKLRRIKNFGGRFRWRTYAQNREMFKELFKDLNSSK
jgi:hypothetical protein